MRIERLPGEALRARDLAGAGERTARGSSMRRLDAWLTGRRLVGAVIPDRAEPLNATTPLINTNDGAGGK